MPTIDIPHDPTQPKGRWIPREHQRDLWAYLERGGKRAMEVWHRRSGKDDTALAWTCVAAHQRVGTYWHMLPQAAQARKAIWDAIDPHKSMRRIDASFPPELRARTQNQEMFIEFRNGSTWQVVGSDNFNSLVGSPPVGIVFSEWALANPYAWAYLKPILEENGGWALFITTSRGNNHARRMLAAAMEDEHWHAGLLPADETGLFSEMDLARIRREYATDFGDAVGDAMFEQEYMCSFEAAIIGAVYGKEMAIARKEGRITRVPHDPAHQVETWWDIGYSDATAIWCIQRIGFQLRAIDYIEESLEDLPYYAKELKKRPYVYSRHLGPHDAGHERIGLEHDSLAKQAGKLGIPMQVQPNLSLLAGINKTRAMLARMVFDSEKCAQGLDALSNYRYPWNEERRNLGATPVHDWSSHGADALRTGAIAGDPVERKPRPKQKRRIAIV